MYTGQSQSVLGPKGAFLLHLGGRRRLGYLGLFSFALSLRTIPELFSGAYPVGFDLLGGYAPALSSLPNQEVINLTGWRATPFAVYLLWLAERASPLGIYMDLKVASVLLFAAFVTTFAFSLEKGLGVTLRVALFSGLIFSLQPAILRLGWDQLREELGFVFLFSLIGRCGGKLLSLDNRLLKLILSSLTAITHEIPSLFLISAVSWSSVKERENLSRKLVPFLPSILLAGWSIYSRFILPDQFSTRFNGFRLPVGTIVPFLTNYYTDPRFLGKDYVTIGVYVMHLSAFTVMPLVPALMLSYRNSSVFRPMAALSMLGGYSILLLPEAALPAYWWWILTLPVPLTAMLASFLSVHRLLESGRGRKSAILLLFILLGIGVGYSTPWVHIGTSQTFSYLPSNLVESSVSFADVPQVELAIDWLNARAPLGVTLVVPENFAGWAYLNLRPDISIFVVPAGLTLDEVLSIGRVPANNFYAMFYADQIRDPLTFQLLLRLNHIVIIRLT